MRTGMCWRKADRGYTRQYYCIAGPITQEMHIIFQMTRQTIRDLFFAPTPWIFRNNFYSGSETRMAFNYEAKP